MENPKYQTSTANLINNLNSEGKNPEEIWVSLVEEEFVYNTEESYKIFHEKYFLWKKAFSIGMVGFSIGQTISNALKDIAALTKEGERQPPD